MSICFTHNPRQLKKTWIHMQHLSIRSLYIHFSWYKMIFPQLKTKLSLILTFTSEGQRRNLKIERGKIVARLMVHTISISN